MNNQAIIQDINKDLAIALPETVSFDELRKLLSEHINQLIKTNFEKLVSILYRIDVSESKLKLLLQESNEDAGKVIADTIIERQLQKIKSRQQFSQRDDNISEEDKW